MVINHCDRRITHLGDMDISLVLFNISSKFLLYLVLHTMYYVIITKNAQESEVNRLNRPKDLSVSLRRVIQKNVCLSQ
jgi:hypothetical protein